MGSPIEESLDLRLHAPTQGLSQLATPFLSAQAGPFTKRRSMSGLLGDQCLIGVADLCTVVIVSLSLTAPFTPNPDQGLHLTVL